MFPNIYIYIIDENNSCGRCAGEKERDMNMMKKLISMLCVTAMLLSVCVCAFADGPALVVAEGETLEIISFDDSRAFGDAVNDGTITSELYSFIVYGNLDNNGEIDSAADIAVLNTFTNNGDVDCQFISTSGNGSVVNTEDGTIETNGIQTPSLKNDGSIEATEIRVYETTEDTGVLVNTGSIETAFLIAESIENKGEISVVGEIACPDISNYDTITLGDVNYYGVFEDADGNYNLLSEGLGVKEGDLFTGTLSATSADGWQIDSDDASMNGKVFGSGEQVSFLVNAVIRFLAYFKPAETVVETAAAAREELVCWMDGEVEKVTEVVDNAEVELSLGVDYYHTALSTFARCMVTFNYEQLQALSRGEHTYNVYLADGSVSQYKLVVE